MNLKRKDIKNLLPDDVTFSLKKVSFVDLARDEAVKLFVYRDGMERPSMLTHDDLEYWKDVIEAEKEIRGSFYNGKRII